MNKKDDKIIIVYGGKSCESDISVITALTVYNSLKNEECVELVYLFNGKFFTGKELLSMKSYRNFQEKKYREVTFKQGKMLKKGIITRKEVIRCALICCHGGQGENGALPGYFEIADIPYTCCRPLQSAVCMDKVFTKFLLQHFHIPTLPFRRYKKGDELSIGQMKFPLIVKPASLGSSIGISIAENENKLVECVNTALLFDEKVLIEKALSEFNEYTCAIFKDENNLVCSEIEEVIAPQNFYTFEEKYGHGETKRIYPAKLSDEIRENIYRTCKKIYNLFELNGVVRIDFLVKDDKTYVNEINTIPGSLSWYLFKNVGYDLRALCRALISDSLRRKENEKSLFTQFDSSVLDEFSFGKGSGKMVGKGE